MKNAIRVPIGVILLATALVMLFLFFVFTGIERVAQLLAFVCGGVIDSCEEVCKTLDKWEQ